MTAFLPPIVGKAYCGCGCGARSSHAKLSDNPHPGLGSVTLLRDGEPVEYQGAGRKGTTFRHFENVAAKAPEHDWRVQVDGPLSDYTYQRQGEALWALVAQGLGFA